MTIGKILVICGTAIVIVGVLAFAITIAEADPVSGIWATPFGVVFLGAIMILAGVISETK